MPLEEAYHCVENISAASKMLEQAAETVKEIFGFGLAVWGVSPLGIESSLKHSRYSVATFQLLEVFKYNNQGQSVPPIVDFGVPVWAQETH